MNNTITNLIHFGVTLLVIMVIFGSMTFVLFKKLDNNLGTIKPYTSSGYAKNIFLGTSVHGQKKNRNDLY